LAPINLVTGACTQLELVMKTTCPLTHVALPRGQAAFVAVVGTCSVTGWQMPLLYAQSAGREPSNSTAEPQAKNAKRAAIRYIVIFSHASNIGSDEATVLPFLPRRQESDMFVPRVLGRFT